MNCSLERVNCMNRNKWKSEGAMSGEYDGWNRISHFTSSKYFLIDFAMCGLVLSCSRINLFCLLFHSGRFCFKAWFKQIASNECQLLGSKEHISFKYMYCRFIKHTSSAINDISLIGGNLFSYLIVFWLNFKTLCIDIQIAKLKNDCYKFYWQKW